MSRKLDAAIAEALGHEIVGEAMYNGNTFISVIPHYSTDGNAMLELDAEMRKRGWQVTIGWFVTRKNSVATYVDINSTRYYQAVADTMPKAVAITAYKALTGEDWQDD